MPFLQWIRGMFNKPHAPPKRPTFTLLPNRVDASHHLLEWCDPDSQNYPPTGVTELLPPRTRCSKSFLEAIDMSYKMMMDQGHALYEEIHTIPAVAAGSMSPFQKTRHWYIVHPLTPEDAEKLGDKVLDDLRKWIEKNDHLYIGTAKHVILFKEKRQETLIQAKKELGWRGVTEELGDEHGYLGEWEEDMGQESDSDDIDNIAVIVDTTDERGKLEPGEAVTTPVAKRRPPVMHRRSTTIYAYGFDEVDQMAMEMARNIRALELDKAE